MDILAADIGGTHSRFALFRIEDSTGEHVAAADSRFKPVVVKHRLHLIAAEHRETQAYDSFAALTESLSTSATPLYDPAHPPAVAALAVPGPIENGDFCAPPNIPWVIRAGEAHLPGIPQILLLNDFAAQAWAALWGRTCPEDVDLVQVLPGVGKKGAPIAVMGAGTGLGKALALEPETHGDRPRVLPSEGGHANVPFLAEDGDFPLWLAQKTGRTLDGDTVLGGKGLALLTEFYTGTLVPEKQAPALAGGDPRVLRHYASLYGRVCRNFVLDTLALGGLVMTGGIAAHLPVLSDPAFAQAFRFCPALPGVMDAVPVWHMRSPTAGLYGAALFGAMKR